MSTCRLKPPGMPKYPITLEERKRELLSDLLWAEKSLIGGDFSHYASLIKSKMELKKINETLFPEK